MIKMKQKNVLLAYALTFLVMFASLPVTALAEGELVFLEQSDEDIEYLPVQYDELLLFGDYEIEPFARLGQIRDPRNSPLHGVVGVTGWPDILTPFTFRIDAAALSDLALIGGSMAVLDFALAGGANAGDVGFAAPWTISATELGAQNYPAIRAAVISEFASGISAATPAMLSFGFPNSHMFHFHPGPNFRVDGETASVALFFDILNSIANQRDDDGRFVNANWLDRDSPGDDGWGRRPGVTLDSPLHERNDHPLPFTTFYRNVQIDLFAGDPSEAWRPLAAALGVDPRQVIVHGVAGWGLFYDIPSLEGWIDVTVRGIRASQDDSAISVSLREGGGGVRERGTPLIADAPFFPQNVSTPDCDYCGNVGCEVCATGPCGYFPCRCCVQCGAYPCECNSFGLVPHTGVPAMPWTIYAMFAFAALSAGFWIFLLLPKRRK